MAALGRCKATQLAVEFLGYSSEGEVFGGSIGTYLPSFEGRQMKEKLKTATWTLPDFSYLLLRMCMHVELLWKGFN